MLASAWAFIVDEKIAPKLSLSNQTHMAHGVRGPGRFLDAGRLTAQGRQALTTLAPENFWVKLAIELAGAALRQVAADEHDDLARCSRRRGVPGFAGAARRRRCWPGRNSS